MKITIAERLKPFSHVPGTPFVLPGTHLIFSIFPALIKINSPNGEKAIPLPIEGPMDGFTIQQDLEKGCLHVWGHTKHGYIRYRIYASQDKKNFAIIFEKKPLDFAIKETAIFFDQPYDTFFQLPPLPRLSLGCHKAQDWTLIRRRMDLSEIFPLWHRLGLLANSNFSEGKSLLNKCQEVIAAKDKKNIIQCFKELFLAGFTGGLSPRSLDEDHNGFSLPPVSKSVDPFSLLSEGAQLILQLFILESGKEVSILPLLPEEFYSGRLINQPIDAGTISVEWSKKTLRRMLFTPSSPQPIIFRFQKGISTFRLRTSEQDKGRVSSLADSLEFSFGKTYIFDRFKN